MGRRLALASVLLGALAIFAQPALAQMGIGGNGGMGGDNADGPLALKDVKFWAYQIQDLELPGNIDAIVNSNYDMVVLDPTRTKRDTWSFGTADMVARIKASKAHDGVHRKRVIAYIDIGEAEDWRWYFGWGRARWTLDDWKSGIARPANWPSFILCPDPDGWDHNFVVAYWNADWKNIAIYGVGLSSEAYGGRYNSIVGETVDDGFDGIYLDWVEGYENAQVGIAAKADGVSPAYEMVKFIAEMREFARSRNPDFVIIDQNAPGLIDDAVAYPVPLTSLIDGISQEDTYWANSADKGWEDAAGYDSVQQSRDRTEYMIAQHDKFMRAGIPVFGVDYTVAHADVVYIAHSRHGVVGYCTRSSLAKLTTTPPPGY